MGDFTFPPPPTAAFPRGLRKGDILRPEMTSSINLFEAPPVVSSATSGLAPRIRPSALYADRGFLYFVAFGNPWGFHVASLADPAEPEIIGEIFAGISPLPYKVRARTDMGLAWICTSSGSRVRKYDVSDPAAPVQIATANCGAQPFGFDVNEDATLIVAATTNGGTGFRVIDQATMTIIGSLIDGTAYADAAIEGGYGYATSFTEGSLRVIDVSDPTTPTLLGTLAGLGGNVRRILVRKQIAYVLARNGTNLLYVIDCTDPTTPTLVQSLPCFNNGDESNLEFNGNVLLTSTFSTGANGRLLRVWSLADPLNVRLLKIIETTGTDYFFGIAAAGDYLYVGNRQFGPDNRVFTLRLR